jgi:dihydrodipicolinate synthase/N-acetylneuraminate lyase
MPSTIDPLTMIVPRRKITGISAILLPFTPAGDVDWPSFDAHVLRTSDAGLTPAVNMDTGYVNLLDDAFRVAVLKRTKTVLSGRPFVAGTFVLDTPDSAFNCDAYFQQLDPIQRLGGTPVIFPSFGLTSLSDDQVIEAHAQIGQRCDRFIAFELGRMFTPFGRIYSLETFRGWLGIPQCIGAKHSSLERDLEWQRLRLRDEVRPDFHLFTGNDLAIDMVMYGSDYLLGLSTFAPDLFATRDHLWQSGDPDFYELNDALQYLGHFAFRSPVPAYKHSAAQFLKLRGWLTSDRAHPASSTRPDSDREILREIAQRLQRWIKE